MVEEMERRFVKFPQNTVLGMLHLPALPGSPGNTMTVDAIETFALRDAESLIDEGVNGLIVENFGDAPFYPASLPPITVACLSRLAFQVKQRYPTIPLGVNALRNDGRSALAVAAASGADFIRVNVLCGARLTDQGLIEGIAHDLMRDRHHFEAGAIQVWADVNVKHSAALADRPVEEQVADTIQRGLADAVIASGSATGQPTALGEVKRFRQAAGETPVFVGSGVCRDNVQQFLLHADGVIVGSAFKEGRSATEQVDRMAVRDFMQRVADAAK